MSGLSLTGTHVIFTNEGKEQVILTLNDYIKNKSRIPMHTDVENGNTISQFLINLTKRNRDLFPEITPKKEIACLTATSIIVSELIKSAAPVKMAEFGSTNGDISYNLMELLGNFHPASQLCLISNTVGNESGNNCLNCITQATAYPEFSMIFSDYTKTNLSDNCFDLVFINGDVCNEDHYSVLKEAERVTKQGGLLICWTSGDCLLESTFKLIFSKREEYELTAMDKLLTTRKTADSWSNQSANEPYAGLTELLEQLEATVSSDSIEAYRPFIKQLNSYIGTAITTYDIKKKLELIELKNALHDYMNTLTTEHRTFYLEKLTELIHTAIK